MSSEIDDIRQMIYDWIKDQSAQIDAVRHEIAEYRKTVNNAIGLLSKELFDFTTKDVAERKARQKRQDIKDAIIGCIGLTMIAVGGSVILLLIYWIFIK